MSSARYLTDGELEMARRLYTDLEMSWKEVGEALGRTSKALQARLGAECSRSKSAAAKKRWAEKMPPGPRLLSEGQQRVYNKLRYREGIGRDEALKVAAE